MSTTRIIPMHTGKGRTFNKAIRDIIDYSKNPQKTDNGRLHLQLWLRQPLDYTALAEKTTAATVDRLLGMEEPVLEKEPEKEKKTQR